jgi:hypothetical protein
MQRCKSLFVAAGVLTLASVLVFAAVGTGAASAVSASSLPTITVALTGKSVTVGGSTVSGAVNVVTTTTNEAAGGTFLFVLKPGETDAAFGQAVQALNAHNGQLDYLDPYGTIVYDAYSPKGVSSEQVVLPAGNYIAVDSNTSSRVPPHAFFTVTPSTSPASLPAPQATIQSEEFKFLGPSTLHRGEVVRFQNIGFLVHMFVWAKAKSMAAAKQAVALILSGHENKVGKNQFTAEGGFVNPIGPGSMEQTAITESPGVYVLSCFMDAQDGTDHASLGMDKIITIKK